MVGICLACSSGFLSFRLLLALFLQLDGPGGRDKAKDISKMEK